jgi:hypothetical protein
LFGVLAGADVTSEPRRSDERPSTPRGGSSTLHSAASL